MNQEPWEEEQLDPEWQPQVLDDEGLEEALEMIAQLENEKRYGQAHALNSRIEKYQYMLEQLLGRINAKIAMYQRAVDAYARPRLKQMGKAVYQGAFGTYRITQRKTIVATVSAKEFLDWCESDQCVVDQRLYDMETKLVKTPNKERIEAYIQDTGIVPPGVVLQDRESFTIKPDAAGIAGKVGTHEKADA